MAGAKFLVVFLVVFSVLVQNGWSAAVPEGKTDVSESRTFGHHFLKRVSFAIIPAAFVVGVTTTLLATLTVMSMKGLGIGVLLLILGLSQVIAKTLPFAHPAPAPAAVPLVYHSRSEPLWLKDEPVHLEPVPYLDH
ncbi:uncharacterized protein LOC113389773 [Ctenocephalides felis]|uniref:uncharacterized protein LOC113389773 n=1 Tax=Ctenocephalides felis TaxID=7515 RepID=UPI000E6E33BE|nr:uncharacterized protein LOC113389773 [Ctenocephalides felis]